MIDGESIERAQDGDESDEQVSYALGLQEGCDGACCSVTAMISDQATSTKASPLPSTRDKDEFVSSVSKGFWSRQIRILVHSLLK